MKNYSLNLQGSLLAEMKKNEIIQDNYMAYFRHNLLDNKNKAFNKENSKSVRENIPLEQMADVKKSKRLYQSLEKSPENIELTPKNSPKLIDIQTRVNTKKDNKKEIEKSFILHDLFVNPQEKLNQITAKQNRIKQQTLDRQRDIEKSNEFKNHLIRISTNELGSGHNKLNRHDSENDRIIIERSLNNEYVNFHLSPKPDLLLRKEEPESLLINKLEKKGNHEESKSFRILSPKMKSFDNNQNDKKNIDNDMKKFLKKQINDYKTLKSHKEKTKSCRLEEQLSNEQNNMPYHYSKNSNNKANKKNKNKNDLEANSMEQIHNSINVINLVDIALNTIPIHHKVEKNYQQDVKYPYSVKIQDNNKINENNIHQNKVYKEYFEPLQKNNKDEVNKFSLYNNYSTPTNIKRNENIFSINNNLMDPQALESEHAKFIKNCKKASRYVNSTITHKITQMKKSHQIDKKYLDNKKRFQSAVVTDSNGNKHTSSMDCTIYKNSPPNEPCFDEVWKGDYNQEKVKQSNNAIVSRFINDTAKKLKKETERVNDIEQASQRIYENSSIIQNSDRQVAQKTNRQTPQKSDRQITQKSDRQITQKSDRQINQKKKDTPSIIENYRSIGEKVSVTNFTKRGMSGRQENLPTNKLKNTFKRKKSLLDSWKGDNASLLSSFYVSNEFVKNTKTKR